MNFLKLGDKRFNADLLECYEPVHVNEVDDRPYKIQMTWATGRQSYLNYKTEHERDIAIENLDVGMKI